MKQSVVQMEPDDINRFFLRLLPLDKEAAVISFTGAGLPQNENLFTMTATGKIAETCNDKWWQYNQFTKMQIPTPKTYMYHGFSAVWNQCEMGVCTILAACMYGKREFFAEEGDRMKVLDKFWENCLGY